MTWLARGDAARRADYDALESLLLKLQRDLKRDSRKGSGSFAEGVRREDVLAGRERLLAALDDFRIRAGPDLAADRRAAPRGGLPRVGGWGGAGDRPHGGPCLGPGYPGLRQRGVGAGEGGGRDRGEGRFFAHRGGGPGPRSPPRRDRASGAGPVRLL